MTTVTQLKVATVDTPTQRILKGKAVLAENHLTVYDRRSGRAVVDVDAVQSVAGEDVWTYRTPDGGVITVTQTGGCGCGGTVITDKETTP